MTFRIVTVEEQVLTGSELSDLLVQLRVTGLYLEPVDGAEVAEIELRFDSAELADLIAQGRAAQLTLAQRARREAEATELGHGRTAALDDVGTLRRLADGLRSLPAEVEETDSSPERGGPRSGGSANGTPVGGEAVREHVSPGASLCKPPLPSRQSGKGGQELRREG